MRFTLEITMKNTEGVLERILGKLRQRNLSVQTINANCSTDSSNIEAKITVESQSNPESITKQLAKLYDVQKINAFPVDLENASGQAFYLSPLAENSINKVLGEQHAASLSV